MKTSFLAAIVTALLICGTAMADTDAQNVLWFADATPTGGTSYMTRSDTMILETLEATGLVPGDATTLWWVVFNNPAGCSDAICGDDEFNPGNDAMLVEAQVAVGNASGNVVRSDGTLEYGAKLTMGWNDPSHEVLFNAGFDGAAMLTVAPSNAEVHVVIQTHGQGRGGKKLREQLGNFFANCTPSCADVQFAVHPAPGP